MSNQYQRHHGGQQTGYVNAAAMRRDIESMNRAVDQANAQYSDYDSSHNVRQAELYQGARTPRRNDNNTGPHISNWAQGPDPATTTVPAFGHNDIDRRTRLILSQNGWTGREADYGIEYRLVYPQACNQLLAEQIARERRHRQ